MKPGLPPDQQETKPDIGSRMMPNIYPPPPIPSAMRIDFKHCLGEYVQIQSLNLVGNVTAAAVAFTEATVIYLVETGAGAERWYPEKMVLPAPLYRGDPGFPPDPPVRIQGESEADDANNK